MSKQDQRRTDDSMMRRVMVAIATAVVIQAGGWIYMLGNLTNQVENNTRLIESQRNNGITMIRIQTLVEGLTLSSNRLADRIESIATEQNRRALIIDRADRFMEKSD